MDAKKAEKLIVKLFEDRLTLEEAEELREWLEVEESQKHFNQFVRLNYLVNNQQAFDYSESLKQVKQRIIQRRKRKLTAVVLKYAAVFIGLAAIGFFVYQLPSDKNTEPVQQPVPVVERGTILPGTDKAVLTLGDGSEITLGEDKSYQKGNIQTKGEMLLYADTKQGEKELEYNELSVPRGGRYALTLADGTKVWLNSESKLRYPVSFPEDQPRTVFLLYGEAYFEVTPSELHHGNLFKVNVRKMSAEVLGTEFNIKAYQEEPNVYTTLVEGSVSVGKEAVKKTLKPYQQAILTETAEDFEIRTVDSFNELLWKEGIFSFKHKTLKEIMTVLSRWYDMEVYFENPKLEKAKFTGVLDKDQSIEEIMKIIQALNELNYEIDDKNLLIK